MSASIGVALGSGEDATADELVRDADIAMYRAKTLGKRRCELFVGEMRLRTQRRTHRVGGATVGESCPGRDEHPSSGPFVTAVASTAEHPRQLRIRK